MRNYYVDTCGKLREIFAEHCNLSMEQFEEISGRLIDLVSEIYETDKDGCGSFMEAERKANELGVIFEFLRYTKEITLKEYNDLCNMVNAIEDDIHTMQEETEAQDTGAGTSLMNSAGSVNWEVMESGVMA